MWNVCFLKVFACDLKNTLSGLWQILELVSPLIEEQRLLTTIQWEIAGHAFPPQPMTRIQILVWSAERRGYNPEKALTILLSKRHTLFIKNTQRSNYRREDVHQSILLWTKRETRVEKWEFCCAIFSDKLIKELSNMFSFLVPVTVSCCLPRSLFTCLFWH